MRKRGNPIFKKFIFILDYSAKPSLHRDNSPNRLLVLTNDNIRKSKKFKLDKMPTFDIIK